jgi:hypothetical protein
MCHIGCGDGGLLDRTRSGRSVSIVFSWIAYEIAGQSCGGGVVGKVLPRACSSVCPGPIAVSLACCVFVVVYCLDISMLATWTVMKRYEVGIADLGGIRTCVCGWLG